ncbi:DUF4328 domain-containing protein [Actinocrispum sp. NPDC049592]|uniref:DUF4328 domain-containing protein n=1 Tax=Actinocrispum sp. NPDC049592 TaxID=3154835 RepID=UPI003431E10B
MGQPHAGLGDSYFNHRDRYRPTGGLSIAAIVGIGLVCVLDIASTATSWTQYNVIVDYFDDRATDADLDASDNQVFTWAIAHLVGLAVAGTVLLVWWYRTHYNARWIGGPDTPGRTGGWVIGAWFCPVANLRFPRDMIADAWRVSAPRIKPRSTFADDTPSAAIINVWWTAFLLSNALSLFATRFFRLPAKAPTTTAEFTDSVHTVAVLDTVASVIYLGAGILAIFIILRLTSWQNTPRTPVEPAAET